MELKGWSSTKRAARRAWQEMSLAEVRLWLELRKGPSGYHFRREHPAGPYRLDFYCAKAKLCVEVDGEAHGFGDRPERDARRDAWLAARGVRTLRIPAREVFGNLEGVVAHIVAAVVSG
ncbi:endonuclease domain-containing protein [Sphingomonas soli]|uniref:endonuclease domain-containing protein n=1 Tax=Sphingomonas soli TaxID=266127 RepID=UPI000A018455|nr:DUF559 domain-containing protein [Sphingomonas soli]